MIRVISVSRLMEKDFKDIHVIKDLAGLDGLYMEHLRRKSNGGKTCLINWKTW